VDFHQQLHGKKKKGTYWLGRNLRPFVIRDFFVSEVGFQIFLEFAPRRSPIRKSLVGVKAPIASLLDAIVLDVCPGEIENLTFLDPGIHAIRTMAKKKRTLCQEFPCC